MPGAGGHLGDPEISSRVVGAGWTRSALTPILGMVMLVGAILSIARGATTDSSSSLFDQVWPILVATACVVVVATLTVFFSFVRQIELTSAQATFRVGFSRVRVAWRDLVPPRAPFFITIVFRYRRDGVVQENSGLVLSRPLARAILEHANCPKFKMDPKIWSSLGLPPQPAAH
jgi:hypothetical protein